MAATPREVVGAPSLFPDSSLGRGRSHPVYLAGSRFGTEPTFPPQERREGTTPPILTVRGLTVRAGSVSVCGVPPATGTRERPPEPLVSVEQARGQKVDKRADIWAFGVVLYEMLTGERLFEGATASDVLAQVLTKEPDLDRVPAKARRLLRRCFEKDPKQRLRDIRGSAISAGGCGTGPCPASYFRPSQRGRVCPHFRSGCPWRVELPDRVSDRRRSRPSRGHEVRISALMALLGVVTLIAGFTLWAKTSGSDQGICQ